MNTRRTRTGSCLLVLVLSCVIGVALAAKQPGTPADPPHALLAAVNRWQAGTEAPPAYFLSIGPQDPQCRHALLVTLEALPSTYDYLGTPVAGALRDAMHEALTADLRTTAWADLNCVPGEVEHRNLFERRAARFREVSLPVLWAIARDRHDAGVFSRDPNRVRAYAVRVIVSIAHASPQREALAARLRELGHEDLSRWLEASVLAAAAAP